MKLKRPLLFGLRLAIAAVLALLAALPVVAQDQDHPRGCSLRTLEGTYGALVEGTVLVNPVPAPLTPPYHSVLSAVVTFDGHGNVSAISRQSLGGLVVPAPPAPGTLATGTYNVNPDCTFWVEFPHFGGVSRRVGTIIREGMRQEAHTIYEDAWLVASGTFKKIPVGSCSLASLQGAYLLLGDGTMPPISAPPLVAQVGILTFDGAGSFSGQETVKVMGAVVPDAPFTGTYTVNPDCTASATVHTIIGDIHEEGVITGEGQFKEFRGIVTDAGWAFAQTLKKQ